MKGGIRHGRQDDISAQERPESKGTRFPQENGHQERPQCSQEKKSKGQKAAFRIMKRPDILRDQRDFNRLYNKGKSSGSRYVVLLCLKNGLTYNRKAFVASKKVGNSVVRHRAVRLMREAFRELEPQFPQGYDLLFIARNTIKEQKCADVKKSIEAASKRLRLLGEEE